MTDLISLCCSSATVLWGCSSFFLFLVKCNIWDRKQAKKCSEILCFYRWNKRDFGLHTCTRWYYSCMQRHWVERVCRPMFSGHAYISLKIWFFYYTKLIQSFQSWHSLFFIQLHCQIYCANPFIYSIYIYTSHNMYICCEHSMQHIKPFSDNIVRKKGVQRITCCPHVFVSPLGF